MSDSPHERSTPPSPADAHWEALARHLAGESDPAESARVMAWLAAHPEDAELLALVKARHERAVRHADAAPVDTERALVAVRARLASEPPTPALRVVRGAAPPPVSRPTPRYRVMGWAAAAVVAAMVGVAQFRGRAPEEGAERVYRTAVGQRDSVVLADGSMVVLAPNSRLTVSASFGRSARDVTLEGAAFFEVQHDAARPFTVHAGDADVRDIGTAFSVKTSPAGAVVVHVTHGIVALGPAGADTKQANTIELRAGDRGEVTRRTVQVVRGVVTPDDVAWTRGRLVYRDAPLHEVRADVRRWYGLELALGDSTLATRTLTATFSEESAEQVVRVIALALGADVQQRGDTVYMRPQDSRPARTP